MADELSIEEQLDQMIAGTHEDVEVEETEDNQIEDEGVDKVDESTDMVDNEDTELVEEPEEEEDTDEEIDESAEETSDNEEETQEEDAHEASDEESETEEVEQTEEDENDDNKADEEDTKDTSEEAFMYNGVDLKKFYEEVALAKFTANGREVEGFKDPKDLIRAQQMLHGYSDKMKVVKENKKFLKPLQERDLLNNPDKFNLAMSLIDGDEDAIKKVLKDKGIDPMELDLEEVNYIPKNTLPSDAQLLIEESVSQAKNLGIEDKFNKALGQDFDDASLKEFVDNGAVRNDLMQHLQDGTYDIVQNEIRNMELLDSTGQLDNMNSIEKYRMAVVRLREKNAANQPVKETEPEKVAVDKVAEEKAEKERLAEEARFKKEAAAKERKAAEARKKAASVSKKKAVKTKVKPVEPEALRGDEFKKYFDEMLLK